MHKSFLKLIICAVCTTIFIGCSRNSSEVTQSEWEKLIAIRGEAREYCRSEMLAKYSRYFQSEPDSVESSVEQTSESLIGDLTSPENLRLLQKIEDSYPPDSEDERKVRRLRHFLIEMILQRNTQEVRGYLEDMRVTDSVKLNNRLVSLDVVQRILTSEKDRDLRQQAYYAWISELQKENAVTAELIRIEDSTAFDLGYGDLSAICQERQQLDYAVLSDQARNTIRETDSLFRQLATEVVPKLSGLKFDMLRGYDIAFLMGTSHYDDHFRNINQMERCEAALAQMGLVPGSSSRLKLVRQTNRPYSRPATYPVTIPDDIRVILPADSGHWETSALMHEIGHALHWLNTEEREFEFTQLGAGALKEAYAFLIEGLLDEPEVVEKAFGVTQSEIRDFLRQRAYVQLMATRSYCGDLLFEQEVHGGAVDLRKAYEEIKRPLGSYGWSEADQELLYRRLDQFASAEYLTGWFLAAQLREHLRDEFGERWYTLPATGEFLKGLWKYGTRKSEFEIAAMLGDSTITPDALIRHLDSLSAR